MIYFNPGLRHSTLGKTHQLSIYGSLQFFSPRPRISGTSQGPFQVKSANAGEPVLKPYTAPQGLPKLILHDWTALAKRQQICKR